MEDTHIHIEEAKEFSEELFVAVKHLVSQLNDDFHPLSEQDMKDMVTNDHTCLLVARLGEKIVGMTTVIFYRIPYRKKGWIEDVVVDTHARGKGVGKQLLQEAIAVAKKRGLTSLNLTSSPHRTGGNNLYQKLGFEKRETNVYNITF